MPVARAGRRTETIPFSRRVRRIFLLAAVACPIPAGISYLGNVVAAAIPDTRSSSPASPGSTAR